MKTTDCSVQGDRVERRVVTHLGESREEFERDRFGTAGPMKMDKYGNLPASEYVMNAEEIRRHAGLKQDLDDPMHSRMIASGGSVWPMEDTGYRRQ